MNEHSHVLQGVITAIGGAVAAAGGPKLLGMLIGAQSRSAKREDALRDELRRESAELRAELKEQVEKLQSRLEVVQDELLVWKERYFKLESDYKVLQAKFEAHAKLNA